LIVLQEIRWKDARVIVKKAYVFYYSGVWIYSTDKRVSKNKVICISTRHLRRPRKERPAEEDGERFKEIN